MNISTDAGNTSNIRDASGTDGTNNNSDGKNAYAKVGFNTYNIVDANTDAGANAGDTSDLRNANDTGGIDNNADNKNIYAKANFSTYNIASTNTGAGARNTIVTNEEVGSNTNNTSISQSGRMGRVNKSGVDRTNKGKISEANIEAGKKVGAETIVSTDNNIDGGSNIID